VQIGERNPESKRIDHIFAAAPLDDLLPTLRLDWRANASDGVTVRYSYQHQDDIAASSLDRAIGSESQRQESRNRMHAVLGSWTRVISPRAVNEASFSTFDNFISPVAPGVQYTFPSLQAGSSFRVPQGTQQKRWQFSDALSLSRGGHQWKFGGQLQRVGADFELGVFQDGRIELVEDFASFDHHGDGRVDDNDLLSTVTLRSGKPDQDLFIPDADNVHVAGFAVRLAPTSPSDAEPGSPVRLQDHLSQFATGGI
jgi:hypothetical protein